MTDEEALDALLARAKAQMTGWLQARIDTEARLRELGRGCGGAGRDQGCHEDPR